MTETLLVESEEAPLRLDRWFRRRYPALPHGKLEKLLRTGQIRVDGKRAKSGQRLEAGQEVRVPPLGELPPAEPKASSRPATDSEAQMLRDAVLYRDEHMIVINKPPGLAVQGGTGMDTHLDAMLDVLAVDGGERPRLVHRLDKDTSGVLLLGCTAAATARLAAAFRSRQARKCYWALVVGVPKYRQGRIDAPLAKMTGRQGDKVAVDEDEGRRAVTYYRVVESVLKKAAWLELEPRTGRTHQLRAHCALLGTPIQGDGKYGGKEAYLSGQGVSRKLHLHARAIEVPHPGRGGLLRVIAPPPQHMVGSFAFFGFAKGAAGEPFTAFEETSE
ncbi:MAG TPA: RluA family pseudouridine synthase [Rhodospirillaceae bacterium]|nr:RluA family pseudouridine synthase [Rhodospirillaceae bacterium]